MYDRRNPEGEDKGMPRKAIFWDFDGTFIYITAIIQ